MCFTNNVAYGVFTIHDSFNFNNKLSANKTVNEIIMGEVTE